MARILIVDDEPSIRYTLAAFLSDEGHQVISAEGYDDAVASLDEAEPDVVFVDILLGDRSGIDILKFIRERGMTCPVVIITGEPSIETAAEALRLGAFDYLSKPVARDIVLRTTHVSLKHRRLEQEKLELLAEKEHLRQNLEAVFRSVLDAIITVDLDMRVTQANAAACEMLGSCPERLTDRECRESFGVYSQVFCQVLQETLKTRRAVKEYRVEFNKPGSRPRTMVLNCSPLLGHDEEFCGVVLLVRDISRLADLERELTEMRRFHRMVGKSSRIQDIFQLIKDLASTDTTVLITGPSGTGKELAAEALHYTGRRGDKPIVRVNCSALSENLLESELFGHVRGAFTGALKDKAGRFEMAQGGTIFLDEIGDISPRIQLKLLRVLQEKEFERVGDATTIKADVRVITATNRNLTELVRRGEFREDLYYRLKVVEIQLPSLSERREDIPLLVEHFIREFNRQFEKSITGVSDRAYAAIMRYNWPGNIRELRHAIEHAFILCRGILIEPEHLPSELLENAPAGTLPKESQGLTADDIVEALRRTAGNKARAARQLGISRQTIYRKIREFRITDPIT